MSTPETPAPMASPSRGPITTVASVGISLFRLGASAVTLPITAASIVVTNLARLGDSIISSGGAVSPQNQNGIVGSAVGAYLGLLKATVDGLSSATRVINSAVNESIDPTRR